MDILLTQSYLIARDPPEHKIMRPFPPLGLMSLASSLRKAGIDVDLCDNTFEPSLSHFEILLKTGKPKLVGISSVDTSRQTALEMVDMAHKYSIPVICGGPDPVNYRIDYFRAGADWICDGEGERIIVELAIALLNSEKKSIPEIKGLYYIENVVEKYTGKRELIPNLDDLPFAAWDLAPIDQYLGAWRHRHGKSALTLISSRGCVRSCRWCSRNVFGKTFRQRSALNFVFELKYVNDAYRPDYFWFADDSFTANEKWLCDFDQQLKLHEMRISYECLGRADEITPEIAGILKRTGARLIWLGAESGSQRILDAMCKGFTIEDISRAREILANFGIRVGFFIMLGYPPEDIFDINQTIGMIRKLKPDKVGVSIAYPIAGTDFYNDVISVKGKTQGWTSSNEDRPIFKTRYNRNFYRFAKRIILKEAQIASRNNPPRFSDKVKLAFYQTGMRFFEMGGGRDG